MALDRLDVAGAGVPIEVIRCTPGRPLALLVLVHGWGESADGLIPLGERFATAGYDTAMTSMRGWGRSGGTDDCGLAQPDDLVAVVEQLRSQVVDPDLPTFLCGVSQGGQAALLAAARDPTLVAAVAAWAPVTDVSRWRATTEHAAIVDYIDRSCADGDLDARSPVAQAAGLVVPVLLVHGAADTRVSVEQSRLLEAAVVAAGGRCRLDVLPDVGHGGPVARREAMAATLAFFDEVRAGDHDDHSG